MVSITYFFTLMFDTDYDLYHQSKLYYSSGAKMGTWKCLRVQGFMIDPESIGVLKEIKLGCHDGNLGELFFICIITN